MTHSAITVIARHSTTAPCDGGRHGTPLEFASALRPGLRVRTPKSISKPPRTNINGGSTLRYIYAPFLYSGRPVISSIPLNLHLRIFSMGSIRLYVIHPVSLWNGTKSSPSACPSVVSTEHGHTSPSCTSPIECLAGHIGAKPSSKTPHSDEIWTHRDEPSNFDSDSRKSVNTRSDKPRDKKVYNDQYQ